MGSLENFHKKKLEDKRASKCSVCLLGPQAEKDLQRIVSGEVPLTQTETTEWLIEQYKYQGSHATVLRHIRHCMNKVWGARRYASHVKK